MLLTRNNTHESPHYYPYGMLIDGGAQEVQPFKYSGKELDRMNGLNWYDHGARMSDPALGRWHVVDPLCEKYYDVSPYAMCGNNPVKFVDKDGRDVVITGPLANIALQQLQAYTGSKVQLTISDDNYLCYNIVRGKCLNKATRKIIDMIDNNNIIVNLITTDKTTTSTDALFIGGAFMGNNVEVDAVGNVICTSAYQEVNPQVLEYADTYSSKGTFIMHELTEAYEGAKISAGNKTSSSNANGLNSVYSKAHNKANPQPPVYRRYFDKDGNVIQSEKDCVRAEWYVKNNRTNDETIIQRLP